MWFQGTMIPREGAVFFWGGGMRPFVKSGPLWTLVTFRLTVLHLLF